MSLPATEALFHLHVRVGQRSAGRSAVAAAAYRAGARLEDSRLGRVFNYTRKGGIVEQFILAPPGAPAWCQNRAELWNRVERSERRKDAVLYREVEVSIPRDLPQEKWRGLIEDACRPYIEAGAVCDVALHCPRAGDGKDQPHAHILITPRALDENTESGFASRRNSVLTARFESGGRLGGGKRGDAVKAERERWATVLNRALRAAGSDRRTDHRSYRDRGIDREAEPHIGEQRAQRVRRTRRTDRRIDHVVALRRLRRVTEIHLQQETKMAKEKTAFDPQTQAVKDRLLKEAVPDLDLSATGLPPDAVYVVRARDSKPLRVGMRDDSWMEYDMKAGTIRYWGGPGKDSQAAVLATALGDATGVDDVAHQPRQSTAGKRGRRQQNGHPFPPRRLSEDEAHTLAERWRARGFTDVDESPDGVWIHLSRSTRLQDTGDRLDVHGKPDADALRGLCLKAKEDWGGAMELFGSADFKAAAWLEAQRQGVEVVGYEPPAAIRQQWEKEQTEAQALNGAQAALKGATAEADLLRRAAAGNAHAGEKLPASLKAFLYGYAYGDEARKADLADASLADLVPELERWKEYGDAWLNPQGTEKELRAWLDDALEASDNPAELPELAPPAFSELADGILERLERGESHEKIAADALRALRLADQEGKIRTAEELRAEIERNFERDAERTKKPEISLGAVPA